MDFRSDVTNFLFLQHLHAPVPFTSHISPHLVPPPSGEALTVGTSGLNKGLFKEINFKLNTST